MTGVQTCALPICNPTGESRPGRWTRRDEVATVIKLLEAKRLNTDCLITERIGVDEILKTYDEILAWKFESMGTIIEWVR